MNQTVHIIHKDIARTKWLLLTWAILGFYCLLYASGGTYSRASFDVAGIFALLLFIGLSLSLIAWIVQEDEVTQPAVFWRTRPISPARILTAKLALLGLLFVLLPAIGMGSVRPRGFEWEIVTGLITWTLLCAAVAACTKDLGRYFLIGMVSFLLFGEFTRRLDSLGFSQVRITDSLAYAILAMWSVAATLVLINQYRCRKIGRSLGVLIATIGLSLAFIRIWPTGL